jgi:hypothetical protein
VHLLKEERLRSFGIALVRAGCVVFGVVVLRTLMQGSELPITVVNPGFEGRVRPRESNIYRAADT